MKDIEIQEKILTDACQNAMMNMNRVLPVNQRFALIKLDQKSNLTLVGAVAFLMFIFCLLEQFSHFGHNVDQGREDAHDF